MHLMYVDESGDDGFKLNPQSDTPGSSKFFIRTGLILHDRCWRRVNAEIKKFRTAHKIPGNVEIHASAIVRGGEKLGELLYRMRLNIRLRRGIEILPGLSTRTLPMSMSFIL